MKGLNWKAARTAAGLTALFCIVYPTTNFLAAQRANVPSFYFEWERHIPFIPLFIIPYMLIDAFFLGAPFLCDDRTRRTHARRIIAATLIAGLFFLLFPLKFAFERPHVDGWLGAIFNNFRTLDQPFNEFPSLHVAYATLLAPIYIHRCGGPRSIGGLLAFIWFALIRLSAVLTYQHHVIDVLGGFALAFTCFHLFQNEPLRQPVLPNRRIGAYYLAGTLALGALALLARPWSLLLLYPAASLALVSSAYFALGPGIFRKRAGRLPFTTWLLLWPVLLGQKLSLFYYARQWRPWDALTDRLWIGRALNTREAQRAIDSGVRAVLDLTGEFSESRPFTTLPYLNLPILDLTAPTPHTIDQALAFLHEHTQQHTQRGVVYLHCKIGYSRTAAIAGAYLIHTGRAKSAEEAIAQLRAARPTIVIRPEARHAIEEFAARPKPSGASHP